MIPLMNFLSQLPTRGKVELLRLDEFILTFNDKVSQVESLDSLHMTIQTLLENCMGIVNRVDDSILLPILSRNHLTKEQLYQIIET